MVEYCKFVFLPYKLSYLKHAIQNQFICTKKAWDGILTMLLDNPKLFSKFRDLRVAKQREYHGIFSVKIHTNIQQYLDILGAHPWVLRIFPWSACHQYEHKIKAFREPLGGVLPLQAKITMHHQPNRSDRSLMHKSANSKPWIGN